jgi:hypothetical protein
MNLKNILLQSRSYSQQSHVFGISYLQHLSTTFCVRPAAPGLMPSVYLRILSIVPVGHTITSLIERNHYQLVLPHVEESA